tara:strand:- start:1228 stop:2292 length:1065 start_codon:yes stop_codon:yes gene_type:complete
VKVLDLFSGIGGFSRGLEAAGPFETIAFVEYEPYCQAVLKHHWPRTKILGDIKNVKKDDIPTRPDVIVGGFPCQPFSVAGSRQAQDDPRHLWPDMFRLIQELRPDWVIGENVAGLIHLGLDEVLTDLENAGYTTRTFNIPACAVGAPHQRYRLWIIAHRLSGREPEPSRPEQQGFDFGDVGNTKHNGSFATTGRGGLLNESEQSQGTDALGKSARTSSTREHVPNANDPRLEGHGEFTEHATEEGRTDTQRQSSESDSTTNFSDSERVGRETGSADYGNFAGRESSSESDRCDSTRQDETFAEGWWESEPQVGRVAHGIPHRVSQLSSLGNSVVPQVVKEIGLAIMEAERGKKT